MPERDEEAEKRNDAIVAALRAQFEPLVERLTPDIEPATVYHPHGPARE